MGGVLKCCGLVVVVVSRNCCVVIRVVGVWVCGCGVYVCGCVGVWVCGKCVGVWVCGCTHMWEWVCGCVGVWVMYGM